MKEICRQIGAASLVYFIPDHHGEEGTEPEGEVLDLPVDFHPHLRS